MAKRKIIWSNEAKLEFFEILDFYFQRNGNASYSRRIYSEIKTHLLLLIKHPNLGKVTNNKEIRFIIENHFLIFYSLSESAIEILGIYDSRRNPDLFIFKK
jgi:plasmid stabilization system protein ParE